MSFLKIIILFTFLFPIVTISGRNKLKDTILKSFDDIYLYLLPTITKEHSEVSTFTAIDNEKKHRKNVLMHHIIVNLIIFR